MASWMIISVSAAAATVASLLLHAEALPPVDQFPEFALRHWSSLSVTWLAVYGVVGLVLSSVIAFKRSRNVPLRQSARAWTRDFVGLLETTQYFSSVAVLLLIGLVQVKSPAEQDPITFSAGGFSLALISCAGLALLGLFGWLLLSIRVLLRVSAPTRDVLNGPDVALVREFIEYTRLHPPASAADLSITRESIDQQRRAIEEMREGVRTLGQLGRTIHDDVKALRPPGEGTADTWNAAQAVMDRTSAELRAAVASLDQLLSRFGDSTRETFAPQQGEAATPQAVRSRLSQELRSLLEQMPSRQKQ